MNCRLHCAACCIAPSINTLLPGMAHGKPTGVPCLQLDAELRCKLYGKPERPAFCSTLQPFVEMCGEFRQHALTWLTDLELATRPAVYPQHDMLAAISQDRDLHIRRRDVPFQQKNH